MRRRAANETIVIALTASIALAACEEERTCVDEVTHEVVPDDQCRDSGWSAAHGSYRPHVWWYGGQRSSVGGTPVMSGGSSHPSSSSHGSSSHHSASYHGSGGHGFGGFHGGFGG